ncbi:MAG: hypothetical protein IJR97_04945 [Clostridia bacterium]|nr:hypothetical protein [Clostridia bacterium]
MDEKKRALFAAHSIPGALFRLAFPTVIGQIILVVYNMADTFFVGLTGNDATLSAVTVCTPAFMVLSAVSNLYGAGGASVISRALGAGESARVKKASSFAFWACLATAAAYALAAYLWRSVFADLLGGTDPAVHESAVTYLTVTVSIGGPCTALSGLMAHLIRAEGRSVHSGAGVVLGGVMNIFLDPLFMFVLLPPGKEALGAATATALSNLVSLGYYGIVLYLIRKKSLFSFRPSAFSWKGTTPRAVISAGLPACVMTLFENVSYAVMDKLLSLSGVAVQAGGGVAKKINMLSHCTVRGITQGALPLIGYNYASGDRERMRKAVRAAHLAAAGAAALMTVIDFTLAEPLTGLFIHSGSPALRDGAEFLRILCLGAPFSASAYTCISFFQAVGEKWQSLVLALMRKGLLDIPLMFLLKAWLPIYGIVAATPIADAACCIAANVLYARHARTDRREPSDPQKTREAENAPRLLN